MSLPVNIFILCYNESVLLPHTITHYRSYLPGCNITIYDNESTDNSVEIAKLYGCNIISWNSNNELNEYIQTNIKNNCWKEINNGWIIMIDMDEWLCVTLEDLKKEQEEGTCILSIKGYDMMPESSCIDLTDVNLHCVDKGEYNKVEDKSLCFYRNAIQEINYGLGAHNSHPIKKENCIIKYSSNEYINKHMSCLGLPFYINKMVERNKRSYSMRERQLATHYNINSLDDVSNEYYSKLASAVSVSFILPSFVPASSSQP